MDFQIVLAGLNHRCASVAIREQFGLSDLCEPANWAIPSQADIHESLILSTCNRVEILGVGAENAHLTLLENWASACSAPLDELRAHAYVYHNLEAVRHIFEVASSLDSMVLGEPQILGQFKDAYRKAVESGHAGSIINQLMHHAFSVGKRVRNETAVAANAVSVSYAAVELAKRIFGALPGHSAMLLGAGEMAELAATHLLQGGIEKLLVLNRTFAHAEDLAARFNGVALPFESLADSLRDVDIVIASTGSREPVITPAHIRKALKQRKNRPIFFIDIAVPRDVDPMVNNFDNIYLYDIDDLKEVVEENIAGRKEEAAKAARIIEEETARFGRWLENLDAKPTIIDLIARGEEFGRMELAATLKRIGPVDPKIRQAIENMAYSLARKFNHAPITYLTRGEADDRPLHTRTELVRDIFNLDAKFPSRHRP